MKQLSILFFFLISSNLFAQNNNYLVDTIEIKSTILNEARQAIMYKPKGVENKDSVKFLYILDGEYSDNLTRKLNKEFGELISDMIVVGIMNTERRRDMLYVNEAGKFLDFITTELIPIVEKGFKTETRILNGHSFSGSFTIYSLLNKPGYFDCYIATSPTPIMDMVNPVHYVQIDNSGKHILFYFSYGSRDMRQVRKWAKKLKENLVTQEFANLDWKFEIHEGMNHQNSDVVALLNGWHFLIEK